MPENDASASDTDDCNADSSRMQESDASSSETEDVPQPAPVAIAKKSAPVAQSTPAAAARTVKSLPARVSGQAVPPQTQKTRPANVNGAPATPSQQNGASAIKPPANGNSTPNKPAVNGGTSAQNDSVGLSNAQLSQGRRQMLDLVNRLHSTGVQVDIDLPQIAVIGSQSAGKSSLIESISGITLPRAAGTCTRCPTECRLSRASTPWQCTVSLRFITDNKGQPLGQARNEVFGSTIYDKAEVEGRIRRAQRAILNPKKSRKTFLLEGDEEEEGEGKGKGEELSFSMNCVSLQISGPDVADLSFCDLPGLIASVSSTHGHANDISLVESLVTSYIKKPSCIILLTVACETDFENQGAHRLAKQYDPEGRRTIGVLTKPDRIPLGEESNWLPFIRNEKETLENNWYCVKQPSSNDLKHHITWSDARKREDDFFSMTEPWCGLDSVYQRYLRTGNLVERLSSLLSDLIAKRLPKIQDELEKSIHKAQSSLSLLPKAPSSDPRNEILSLLHEFMTDVSRHVEGVPDEDGLLQAIRPAQERFRRAVRGTAPRFRPFERKFRGERGLKPAAFLSFEEGEGDVEEDEDEDDGEQMVQTTEGTGEGRKRKHGDVVGHDAIYIDEVYERAHRARTRELPGNYPFVVQSSFINSIIKEWREPAIILCKTIHATIMEHCKKLVKAHFGEFGQGALEQRVKAIIQKHINDCLQRTEDKVDWLLELEDKPFSLNNHYLADYKAKFLSYYKGARERDEQSALMKAIQAYNNTSSSSSFSFSSTPPNGFSFAAPAAAATADPFAPPAQTGMAKVLAGLAELGVVGVKPEDIPKLLPPDKMEPALVIMADVRAYFQVAYKRFVDNVPLAIDHELVRGVERGLLSTLYTSLGVNSEDGTRISKELAQESSGVAHRRAELGKKLERLRIASEELFRIGV